MSALGHALPACGPDVDDLRDAWREACNDLRRAYRHWRDHGPAEGRDHFAVYVAAADREAAAADVLARYVIEHALVT